MSRSQRTAREFLWWVRCVTATLVGFALFLTGNAYLNSKLRLGQADTLSVFPPPGVNSDDWHDQRHRTPRFIIVFGEHELMRDDNPERRDTRADIERWANLLDWVRILVPLACGVLVCAGVYVLWGLFLPNRKRDES